MPHPIAVPTPRHSAAEGHESADGPSFAKLGIGADCHAGHTALGSVVVTARPASSSATHSDADRQAIATSALAPSIPASCHDDAPPSGSSEVTTSPESPTMGEGGT